MIFKDRAEAGKKLAERLEKNLIVVSLVRGGVVVGAEVAKILNLAHLPLVSVKISAPGRPELAIGGLCFNSIFIDKKFVKFLGLEQEEIDQQIDLAQKKFVAYNQRFHLNKQLYKKKLKDKKVVVVDDGIATGATVKAGQLFLKTCRPVKIYLAAPVAPADFHPEGFDKVYILSYEPSFSAVSQFYESFSQVENDQVKVFFPKLFHKKKNGRRR